MACCCGSKDAEDATESSKNPMVPSSERKCRDVLCCLLFVLYWIGMIIVAYVGIQRGKPQTLIHPKDFSGKICGIDADVKNASFAFYPRLAEDIYYAAQSKIPLTKMKFYSVCVETCPHAAEKVDVTIDNVTQSWTSALDTRSLLYRCLPSGQDNKQVLSRECIDPVGADPSCTVALYVMKQCSQVCKAVNETSLHWSTAEVDPDPLTPQLQTTAAIFGRLFGDVKKSALTILLFGGLGSFVLGVIWIFFLGYFAKIIVWVTCFLVMIVMLLLSLFCSIEGKTITDGHVLSFIKKYATINDVVDDTKRKQFAVLSYISWVITGILFLLIIAMRKRIRIAIAVIKEASRSLRCIPFLLLWPIIPTIAVIGIAVYWIVLSAFLLTTDSFSFSDLAQMAPKSINISAYTNLSDNNATSVGLGPMKVSVSTQNILFLYHLFGFLWTNQLFQAISICTIAGSIAEYYWSPPDQFGQRALSSFPVFSSLCRTLRYHIGSLCFGSLIIAIVQFIRIILQYIDQNTKTLQENNTIIKITLKIVQCCLWCFEKFLKFISSNAYIIIAMKGSSFCSATMQAFVLILTNVARIATLNTITFFMLLLVKITVVVSICLIVFTILIPSSPLSSIYISLQGNIDPVTSPIAPVIITGIIAYFVSSILLNLYDMTIDTILLCFCEDAKINNEKASPYMSKELQEIMGGGISPTSPVKVTPREEKK